MIATTVRELAGSRVANLDMRASILFVLAPALYGCGTAHNERPDAAIPADAAGSGSGSGSAMPDAPVGPAGCTPGAAGAPCVLALYDRASASCADADVTALRTELDLRAGIGPLWAGGRALVRTAAPIGVAGDWNGWAAATALPAIAVCGHADVVVAVGAVPTGYHQYKLVTAAGVWSLDPSNPAFAYDDFAGNPDGENSVLNTPDSGRGKVVRLLNSCSTALGNCRDVTAYLPAGYDAPEHATTTYPVMFFHDGQNVWSDHDCCFGHTGWEVDGALDGEIAGGHVRPVIAIAADNTTARNNEYGLDVPTMKAFIAYQVNELQPAALAKVRWDQQRVTVVGSSLGGLVSMELALRHPEVYAGAASLSGAFWPNQDTHTALRDDVPVLGKQALALYVDSGGKVADNSDGAADTVQVRDELITLGWAMGTSPACTNGPSAICYYIEPGATHDELAWKARVWRALRFLAPPPTP